MNEKSQIELLEKRIKELEALVIKPEPLDPRLPLCPNCKKPITCERFEGFEYRHYCDHCDKEFVISRAEPSLPEPKEPLPICKDCGEAPASTTVWSEKGVSQVCGRCARYH